MGLCNHFLASWAEQNCKELLSGHSFHGTGTWDEFHRSDVLLKPALLSLRQVLHLAAHMAGPRYIDDGSAQHKYYMSCICQGQYNSIMEPTARNTES